MIVKNRIKKHNEFQDVINTGKLEKTDCVYMHYLNNKFGYTRVGISVPKKSGNAVIRNKIKRQIRSIIAALNDYTKSYDLVFIVRKAYDISKFETLKAEISKLFEKLGN